MYIVIYIYIYVLIRLSAYIEFNIEYVGHICRS